jgi:hypothetical protein
MHVIASTDPQGSVTPNWHKPVYLSKTLITFRYRRLLIRAGYLKGIRAQKLSKALVLQLNNRVFCAMWFAQPVPKEAGGCNDR